MRVTWLASSTPPRSPSRGAQPLREGLGAGFYILFAGALALPPTVSILDKVPRRPAAPLQHVVWRHAENLRDFENLVSLAAPVEDGVARVELEQDAP